MKKSILLTIIFVTSLLANETLLDIYQKEGSRAIEKILDKELTSTKYWETKLEHIDTSFGYLQGTSYILACDKNQTTLKLYTKDKNSSFELNSDFAAFVGKKSGDKQREGDLKTPIGIYKIIQKLDKVDEFYGPLAFVTSYPNTYDKSLGKNGSGIWVHGLPLHEKRDDYTKGCIAINNDNLRYIEKLIELKKAFVYIDKKEYPKVKKADLVTLLSQLFIWRRAWKESNIKTYLNFYDKNFKHDTGLNLDRFKKYKERIFAKNEYKQIIFSNINILPYPTDREKNMYLISFHEIYRSNSYFYSGEKELYVKLNDKSFSIIAEK